MSDFCQRFLFESGRIRGQVVTLSESIATALSFKSYPPEAASLQGQAFAAVSLLANTVKMTGGLILQVQGDGVLKTLVAQVNHLGHLRGLVHSDDFARIGSAVGQDFSELVGDGRLVITIDAADNKKYQGIVNVEGATLAAVVDGYFEQSEQLPTRIWLASDGRTAGGILLQCLPGDSPVEDQWRHLVTLTETISAEELITLQPEDILHRLYHLEELRVFEPVSLSFKCSCSREKIETVLMQLGQPEVEKMALEDGQVEVCCEFCAQSWVFDPVDVSALFRRGVASSDALH